MNNIDITVHNVENVTCSAKTNTSHRCTTQSVHVQPRGSSAQTESSDNNEERSKIGGFAHTVSTRSYVYKQRRMGVWFGSTSRNCGIEIGRFARNGNCKAKCPMCTSNNTDVQFCNLVVCTVLYKETPNVDQDENPHNCTTGFR